MRRLRIELIALLVLAMALPLVPAGFAARELFRRSLDPLLGSGVAQATDAALAVTRDAIDVEKARWARAIADGARLDTLDARRVVALGLESSPPRPVPAGAPAGRGPIVRRAPELVSADSAAVLVAEVSDARGVSTWVWTPLPQPLAARAVAIERAARLVSTLRREREPLLSGFLATFLAVYVGLVALVLGLGLWLLSRLTRPLADLSRGIDRVAAGDLEARVPERGGAELEGLSRKFNAMALRLHEQQGELGRLERLAAWRQMARFLAHEIKNPLTPIQLAAEQMRDTYRGDDSAYRRLLEEGAAIIQEEVAGLRTWASEFSQFARLPEMHVERVPAADLAAEVVALYEPGALEARIERGAGDGVLACDPDQVKRVLVNLVDNALAAQRGAGVDTPVELAIAWRGGGDAVIRVRDRGPGIAAADRRRVFEPDFTTKSDGMGLGLAIVESIVRQHGGSIAIPETDGPGATFEVVLPAPRKETVE